MKNIASFKYSIICLGLVGILLASCQTVEFPEPKETGSDTPQFLFEGMAGDNALNWAAGQSNYFMETSTEKDQNGVYNFRGHLKEEGCTGTCPNSLMINIRDAGVSTTNAALNINEVFRNGTVQLANNNFPDSFKVKINTRLNNENFDYKLLVNEDTLEVNDRNQFTVPANDNSQITLTAKHKEDWINYSLTQPLFPDGKNRLKVELKSNGRALKIFLIPTPDKDVEKIIWPDESNGKMFTVEEKTNSRIVAKVLYKNGHEAKFTLVLGENFTFERFNEGFVLDFDYIVNKLERVNPKHFNTVEINYFDNEGNRYSSVEAVQSNTSVFKIEESDNFKENQQGQKTKKINFELNMNVKNKEGVQININGSGIFALAYPS